MFSSASRSTLPPTTLVTATTQAATTINQDTATTKSLPVKKSKLSITADDQIVELYVDGVQTSIATAGWQTVRVVDIPEETEVIAVKAIDTAGVR